MKKNLGILFFLIIFTSVWSQTSIKAVVTEWPPFQYSEGNQIKGVDVEILRAVFKNLNQELVIETYPWSRCVSMVQNKQADIIFTLAKNAEREEYLIFPTQPINVSENVLFILNGSDIKFNSYNDLKGLTIGVTTGYNYGDEFNAQSNFKKIEYADEETNFRMLAAGRIDAFVCDKLVGAYVLKQKNMTNIVFLPKAISTFQMSIGLSKKTGAQELANRFDKAILALKASGEYQKIMDSYIK